MYGFFQVVNRTIQPSKQNFDSDCFVFSLVVVVCVCFCVTDGMNARVFTAVVVAAVVVLAAADPLVQVRKGATPVADAKPNTFRVDLAFRVVEEAGEDAGKRVVSVAESLPETVSLVSGELARKFTVDSVEVDAAPMDGWTSMEYVVCADKVKFTLKNLTFGVVIPPSRISVLASEEENAEIVVSDYSEPLALRAVFPTRKAPILFVFLLSPTFFLLCRPFLLTRSSFRSLSILPRSSANFKYRTPCAYVLAVVLPVLLAMLFVKVCAAAPKAKSN